jgi:hypothetical protein
MDYGPVVKDDIDAGAALAREYEKRVSLKAAFWLKLTDREKRYLYLASKRVDDIGLLAAYGELVHLTRGLAPTALDALRVRLLSAEDPLTKAAADFNQRFPSRTGIRLGGTLFGGVNVDDVYIYPSPLPAVSA